MDLTLHVLVIPVYMTEKKMCCRATSAPQAAKILNAILILHILHRRFLFKINKTIHTCS